MLFISTNLKAELAIVVSDELQLMKDWFGVNRLSLNLEISYFLIFIPQKQVIPMIVELKLLSMK